MHQTRNGKIINLCSARMTMEACCFLFESFNDVKKLDVHDKAIGIIIALGAWRHHLEGAKHRVEYGSDHRICNIFMFI